MKKYNKIALLSLCTFFAIDVSAADLGYINTLSIINEPFRAKIPILRSKSWKIDQVNINIADAKTFTKYDLKKYDYLNDLKIKIYRDNNRGGLLFAEIYSHKPFNKQIVDFLLNIKTPEGHSLQEFAILLEPPVIKNSTNSLIYSNPVNSVNYNYTFANIKNNTVNKQSNKNKHVNYKVKSGDNLWSIAEKFSANKELQAQAMLAIYQANKNKFIHGDIHLLQANAILHIPKQSSILSVSQQRAMSFVAQHKNKNFHSSHKRHNFSSGNAYKVKLRVAANGTSISSVAKAKNILAINKENIAAYTRSLSLMKKEYSDLTSQLQTLKKLVNLKNTEIIDLKNQMSVHANTASANYVNGSLHSHDSTLVNHANNLVQNMQKIVTPLNKSFDNQIEPSILGNKSKQAYEWMPVAQLILLAMLSISILALIALIIKKYIDNLREEKRMQTEEDDSFFLKNDSDKQKFIDETINPQTKIIQQENTQLDVLTENTAAIDVNTSVNQNLDAKFVADDISVKTENWSQNWQNAENTDFVHDQHIALNKEMNAIQDMTSKLALAKDNVEKKNFDNSRKILHEILQNTQSNKLQKLEAQVMLEKIIIYEKNQ